MSAAAWFTLGLIVGVSFLPTLVVIMWLIERLRGAR